MPPPTPAQVLVIDDEPDLRTLYELTLLREGHRISAAGTLAEARALLAEQSFDAIISDMRLPDGLGLTLLHELTSAGRPERCIVITAYGSAESAVESLKAGAFDYLTKPVDLKQLRTVVTAAIAARRDAGSKPNQPQALVGAPSGAIEKEANGTPGDDSLSAAGAKALARLVGDSPPMRAVKQRIAKAARSMAPVLVRGESGTGKELVASAIHACSHRADGPFIAVNCGAIPEALLEAEFFGARKGSYTGASADRDGFFQAARGGTLFLDEIGDLPLAMQAKLLRALQERSVRPLGSTQEEPVDVRIVSATHKDLAAGVADGKFRQDLYYRLNVIEIVIPPLRERLQDLPLLCQALVARIARDTGLPAPALTPELLRSLAAKPLEGNVRELENLLHRAIALGDGDQLQLDSRPAPLPALDDDATTTDTPAPMLDDTFDLIGRPPSASRASPPDAAPDADAVLPANLETWLDQQERAVLLRALEETGFNRTAAGALLGLNLRQMRYRMARLNITAPGAEADGD